MTIRTKPLVEEASIESWWQLLQQQKAIAIIRCGDRTLAYKMAQAAASGGIKLIEITWNSEDPDKLITQLRNELPECSIGAGTILNLHQLQSAVAAGAQFAFAPNFNPRLLNTCQSRYKIPFIPGVYTPTEVVNAWQQGAKAVKIFPIKSLGGASYIKCLQAPLGHIPLIPTGGITVENAPAMIDAGAIAVGISSDLFPQRAIAIQDWSEITSRAKHLLAKLKITHNYSI